MLNNGDTPVRSGRWSLVVAVLTGALGIAMLLSLVPEERRHGITALVAETPERVSRPARVVALDCTREAVEGRRPCTDDKRFEVRYRYQFEGETYESDRLAPERFLAAAEPEWHEQMHERFSHAQLHSRPVSAHVNPADPQDALIIVPEPVYGPLISLLGGLLFMLVSALALFRYLRP